MLALYRCGRQAEALEVDRAARLTFADERGLDPSPELQELERKVLRQDPALLPARRSEPRSSGRLSAGSSRCWRRSRLPTTIQRAIAACSTRRSPTFTRTLARNGGTLERFGAEGLVAVFGADAPRDDDAHRAVATAEELGLPAGIATGEVVAGREPLSTARSSSPGRPGSHSTSGRGRSSPSRDVSTGRSSDGTRSSPA